MTIGIPRKDFLYHFLHLCAVYRIREAELTGDSSLSQTAFLEWILFSLVSDPLNISQQT